MVVRFGYTDIKALKTPIILEKLLLNEETATQEQIFIY